MLYLESTLDVPLFQIVDFNAGRKNQNGWYTRNN